MFFISNNLRIWRFSHVSAIFATLHWVNSQLLPAGCRTWEPGQMKSFTTWVFVMSLSWWSCINARFVSFSREFVEWMWFCYLPAWIIQQLGKYFVLLCPTILMKLKFLGESDWRWMEAVTAVWWNEISFRSHLSLSNYFDSDTLCGSHGCAQVHREPPCSIALDLFSQCQLLPKPGVSGGPNGWQEPREAIPCTEDVER